MRVHYHLGYWNAVMDGVLVARDRSLTVVMGQIKGYWDSSMSH